MVAASGWKKADRCDVDDRAGARCTITARAARLARSAMKMRCGSCSERTDLPRGVRDCRGLGSAATGRYSLQLDLRPEWQRAGLKGQAGRCPGRAGELPPPPVVDIGVVAAGRPRRICLIDRLRA